MSGKPGEEKVPGIELAKEYRKSLWNSWMVRGKKV